MGLFKRIGDNIRANLNALLDQAEDPVRMLEQYLRDMEDDIGDAESAVARQLAVVRKFQAQYKEASAMVDKRESQAMEALEKGREDLARKALEDKKLHQARAEDYRAQYEKCSDMAEKLKSQLGEMKDEFERLRAKKDSLVARVRAAKAQKEVHGLLGGFGKDGARRGFERMEEKVLQAEAEAEVAAGIMAEDRSLDLELSRLGNDDIDRELEELRQRLAGRQKGQE